MYVLIIVTACFGVLPCCAYIVCKIFNYQCYEPGYLVLFSTLFAIVAILMNFCVNLRIFFFFFNPGTVLAATQRLKQISSTADQRHLTGKGGALHSSVSSANYRREPELFRRGKEDSRTQADYTKGGMLQQGPSMVQKRQNDPVFQTIADPGKQVYLLLNSGVINTGIFFYMYITTQYCSIFADSCFIIAFWIYIWMLVK